MRFAIKSEREGRGRKRRGRRRERRPRREAGGLSSSGMSARATGRRKQRFFCSVLYSGTGRKRGGTGSGSLPESLVRGLSRSLFACFALSLRFKANHAAFNSHPDQPARIQNSISSPPPTSHTSPARPNHPPWNSSLQYAEAN